MYRSGDFRFCAELLTDSVDAEGAILRSRAMTRLGDAASALKILESCDFADESHEIVAEALAVQSYALQALQLPVEAGAIGVEARARCYSAGFAGIEAELIFATVVGAMLVGDADSAKSAAKSILDLVEDAPTWLSSRSYTYSLGYWRARACETLAIVEGLKTNYAGYAAWLRKAFDEFDASGVQDEYTHVMMLANYADAAITLGLPDIIDFVVNRATVVRWNGSLVDQEFRVFSALAEASSAIGDQVGALRYFRRCLDCAPSVALQVRAGVERGRLLHEIGELFAAREELDHAVRLSRTIDWENVTALEQRQLVFLAAQVATYDFSLAETLLTRFDNLASSNLTSVAIKDDRFRGEEFIARAAVLRASQKTDRAILLLIDALAIFTAANLELKAAYAAAELATLTNEPRYVDIAHKQCTKQPHSILARKMARYDGLQSKVVPTKPTRLPRASASRVSTELKLLF